MRAIVFAVSVLAACSSVPEVVFVDAGDLGADAATDGGGGGASSSSGAASSSSSGGNSGSELCRSRQDEDDVGCCKDTPCWGPKCPQGCAWCEKHCNAPDKRCCLPGVGPGICVNLDESCEDKLK